jgi:nucleoid-associated protein YgaU
MATISLPAPAIRRPARTQVRRPAQAAGGVPQAARTSVRLTRRGRRLARTAVIVLALLTALLVSVAGRGGVGQATDAPAQSATTTVVVQPGQTLWQVARSVSKDADPRETLARLQELNGLTGAGSLIHPGQQLVVPAAG